MDASELESKINGITFMNVDEVPGVVDITRTTTGWKIDEYLSDEDSLLTGEVETTEVAGSLLDVLLDFWPDDAIAIAVEGLDAEEALAYVHLLDQSPFGLGDAMTINDVEYLHDGEAFQPD